MVFLEFGEDGVCEREKERINGKLTENREVLVLKVM